MRNRVTQSAQPPATPSSWESLSSRVPAAEALLVRSFVELARGPGRASGGPGQLSLNGCRGRASLRLLVLGRRWGGVAGDQGFIPFDP
jgi:hypothetical protein